MDYNLYFGLKATCARWGTRDEVTLLSVCIDRMNTEKIIIEQLKAGDEQSYKYIYDHYSVFLYLCSHPKIHQNIILLSRINIP